MRLEGALGMPATSRPWSRNALDDTAAPSEGQHARFGNDTNGKDQ